VALQLEHSLLVSAAIHTKSLAERKADARRVKLLLAKREREKTLAVAVLLF
jgi:hypothetical protein